MFNQLLASVIFRYVYF